MSGALFASFELERKHRLSPLRGVLWSQRTGNLENYGKRIFLTFRKCFLHLGKKAQFKEI